MERRRLRVRGTVQGVGFRPFVYQQAMALGLTGWVGNDGEGVLAEIEGDSQALDRLEAALRLRPPPLALIESIQTAQLPPTGVAGFVIAASRSDGSTDVPVSADVAPCSLCLAEMRDVDNRRFGYPFINCTDCGPRFTIVRGVPYDRGATTMATFTMCPLCQSEYDDPADRRFHAQPNACPDCGPQLRWSSDEEEAQGPASLAAAAHCLLSGGIVAVKGIGGYHLACDATNAEAVRELRRRKRRDAKPFAVMVGDLAAAEQLVVLSTTTAAALSSPRRPVVLAPDRGSAMVVPDVAPHLTDLGVMLPSSPLHELLLDAVPQPLVMTSGNVVDHPVAFEDDDAWARLSPLVDGILLHDRPIQVQADDSVLRAAPHGRLQMLRRARGWAPQPVRLPVGTDQPVLAVGAQLKSTVAIARGKSVILSQHLGDLDQWSTYRAFVNAVRHLTSLTGAAPALIAHDLHPDYRSTAWAQETGLPLLPVQHHHAHIASCLLEHGRTAPVLGIAFDGTGLGPEGSLWGGELLVADLTDFQRVGHLLAVPLPGGDAAVREPWRMAMSWLEAAEGATAAESWGAQVDPRAPAVQSLLRTGRQPLTSSVGRLFDAVAALLGVRSTVSYEGQAAMELEALARSGLPGTGCDPLPAEGGVLDARPLIRSLRESQRRGDPIDRIAAAFHVGVAEAAAALAIQLAADEGLDTIALSGGVFQNVLLSDLLSAALRRAGLHVLVHKQLPANDGGISAGQAAIAAATSQQ
ncbi:MAG: carbamoyltransferase HypF [Actinobacteria bacterium]|nr:carbamoyltransferase HypF [Actinomycetota bacterium]MCA1721865.1 carbamoyltransferase HypF [Actinomycetota bacterium]